MFARLRRWLHGVTRSTDAQAAIIAAERLCAIMYKQTIPGDVEGYIVVPAKMLRDVQKFYRAACDNVIPKLDDE
jgi:hypothetical protein